MRTTRNLVLFLLGIVFIIVGVWLMVDFLIKFLSFTVGLILLVIGINLVFKKWY